MQKTEVASRRKCVRRRHMFCGRIIAASSLLVMAAAWGAAPGYSQADNSQVAPAPDESKPAPIPAIPGIVVLFGGQQADLTDNWLQAGSDKPAGFKFDNGILTAAGSTIMTKQKFTDYLLHVEFREPFMPTAHGQERGNSGVYMQGRYEIQVLDSYSVAEPGKGDCGAVYNQSAPLVKAYKPPLQWQTYDISFRAPRFDADGKKMLEQGRVTILLNGITIQNNTELQGATGGALDNNLSQPGPILLQFHGNPVAFRNIWILPLPAQGASHY